MRRASTAYGLVAKDRRDNGVQYSLSPLRDNHRRGFDRGEHKPMTEYWSA